MKKTILTSLLILNTAMLFAQIADSAKRKVSLQGTVNFRDIGGYTTKDGHHVKWGKVYRSADLSKLSETDLAELKNRKITYDVDLRGTQEAQQAPDKLNPNTDYILCPAGSDSVNTIVRDLAAHKNTDSLMTVFYTSTRYFSDRYKPFFNKLLALPDNESLVFHCTAGKDRTGIAAALLLYSLGVPYDTIMADYTATNYYRQAESQTSVNSMVQLMHVDEKSARNLTGAKKEYLDASFAAINKRYGSVDAFLKNEIGLTNAQIKVLKQKYLQ
ncbi:MAG: tyrosine-protein phosphatase [Mucilaginibacter sp.]|nr:tyrosine-protein phosphatase [Mucilaginibacter sp.]